MSSSTVVTCRRVSVQDMVTKNVVFYYFAMETEVKDVEIVQMLNRLHASDFNENCLSLLIANFLSQLGFPMSSLQTTEKCLKQD